MEGEEEVIKEKEASGVRAESPSSQTDKEREVEEDLFELPNEGEECLGYLSADWRAK